ncbi:MAG: rhodanese-like domain-containing protein [Aggregatilineales bacterium]
MSSNKRRPSELKPTFAANLPIALGAGVLVIVAALVVSGTAGGGGAPQVGGAARGGLLSPGEEVAPFGAVPHLLLDVRTVGEFQSGHLAGAVNIPVEQLAQRLAEVPRDLPIVLYCRSGNRSAAAARLLRSAGYESVYDLGGIIRWQAQGYPIQR